MKISEFHLKNDLKIIVKENHRSPVAVFLIIYKVGSSFEIHGITGLSHALEHMMFRGTKHHSGLSFMEKIARAGGELNAYTTYDYTLYYEILPVEKLELAFRYEADRMANLLLANKDFKKEIQVVIEERRLKTDNNPLRLLMERFKSYAQVTSPYRHPIIGWMHNLQHMTVEDLSAWYRQWYQPNNAIIIVAGDVKPADILALSRNYFEPVKSGSLPSQLPPNELIPSGIKTATMKIESRLPYLLWGYNVPAWFGVKNKSDIYALLVLCEILAGSHTARFQLNLQQKQQLIMDIHYEYQPFLRGDTLMMFTFMPNPNCELEKVKEGVFHEIERIKKVPPKKKELEKVKVHLLADEIYQQDSIAHQALEMAVFEGSGISYKWIKKI